MTSRLLGSTFLYQSNGTTRVTDASAITALGTAVAIAGQGLLATLNQLANGSQYLSGFGSLSSLASIAFNSPFLLTSSGAQATDSGYQTALGVASAFAGQGPFATISSAAYGSNLLTGFGALAPLGSIAFNSSYLVTSSGAQATDANYQTAQGTAGAIAGQAWAATQGTQARTDNLVVPVTGANRIRFSQWEGGSSNGWTNVYLSSGVTLSNYRTDTYAGKKYLGAFFVATGANQSGSLGGTIRFPVTPGETLSAALGLQANGPVSQRQLAIFYYRADGTQSTVKGGDSTFALGSAPFDTRIEVRSVVPSDAVTARIEAYAFSNGSGTMDVAITDPMVTSISPSQPNAPAFVAGLNASDGATVGSDVQANLYDGAGNRLTRAQVLTALGISGGFSGQAALATLNQVNRTSPVTGRSNTCRSADEQAFSSA